MTNKKRWGVRIVLSVAGLLFMFFLLALLQRSTVEPKIKHIDFKKLADNRLRFKVSVETAEFCNVVLKYWPKKGGDTLYSTVSKNSVRHTLWIVNVKEQTNYQFQVLSFMMTTRSESKIYDFTSSAIYQATPFVTLDFVDSTYQKELTGKYFLTQKLDQPGAVIMLDHQGDIIWYESFKKGVRVSNWTKHKTVLCILGHDSIPFSGGDEIVEVALSGEIVTHLKRGEADMDKVVHHDVRFDENNNIYALTFDWKIVDLSTVGGTKQDSILGDGIVVLDRTGHKVWEWSVFDHLDPLKDPKILKDRRDWVHANSLVKDPEGNYIISFRDLNQIWKVDGKNGDVKWKFGKGGDFELSENYFFSGQHGTHISTNGELLMLDNGIHSRITRVLSFNLNTLTKKALTTLEIPMASEYFSIPKGSVHRIGDDKYLLCLSQPRALLIVDSKGKIWWKVVMGGDPYRVEVIDNLNEVPDL